MKIYSKLEEKNMLHFQVTKDKILLPLTKLLLQWKVSANFISVLSGFVAVFSFLLSVQFNTPLVFIFGIWFHFFLDGLDGSLARAYSKETNGLAMDLSFDSIGIVVVGLYSWYLGHVGIFTALLFVISYLAVNLISYVFATTGREYSFVIRPRIFVFTSIAIDYFFLSSTTAFVIFISNVILVLFALIGILKLLKK